uniref:Mitochondrial uncoupling protein 4 n=1 Tax=Trichuris muris TaxID=70415 RepID=A0A5S6QJT1_TRIMR
MMKSTDVEEGKATFNQNAESYVAKYLLSCGAATVAETATYPLDLLKTRLQLQVEHESKGHPKKAGAIVLFSRIATKEGPLGLWQGVTPAILRHYIYTGFRVVIYEECRERVFGRDADGTFPLGKAMLTGVLSGALAQFVASPADLVKVLMQAEGRRKLDGLPPRVENVRHAFKVVWSEGGVPALWRGWSPSCQRAALVNMSDMATYDTVKHLLLKHTDMADNYVTHALSSACSGLAAALTSTPMDVVKTRMMNQAMRPSRAGDQAYPSPQPYYKSTVDCLRRTVRNESFLALYKGFWPIWARMAPWSLTFWVSYERIRWLTGASSF